MSEQSNGGRGILIVIILVVVLGSGAGAWYFFMYKPEQEAKERARLEQIAREKQEQERRELELQNRARYDQLIVQADSAFAMEKWEEARTLYTQALSIFPDPIYPRDQLALIQEKLDRMAGQVKNISSPTGRYYVIVSSSLDDDLAMDYANKLSDEGSAVKVIDHSAYAHSFYGVSLGDYDTFEQAVAALPSFSQYADEAWVLKF